MNWIRCLSSGYHALRMKADRRYRVPLTTTLSLHLKCALACRYCPLDHEATDRLPLDVIKRIFRDLRDLGGQRVHLSGGEPMLREDLPEIAESAKRHGLFVSLTTRGAGVRRQKAALDFLDQAQVSFDGPPEVRAALRSDTVPSVAEEAMATLRERGIPFWTVTVLNKLNVSHIDWIVNYAARVGARANFVLMEKHPELWNAANPMPPDAMDLLLSDEESRQAIRHIIELKRHRAPIGSSMPYLLELLEWKDHSVLTSPHRSSRYPCRAWQSQCEIFANGDLHICDWTMQRQLGVSVLEHGFREAWLRVHCPVNCNSCIASCNLEANLLFGLNPSAVMNWVGNLRAVRSSHD